MSKKNKTFDYTQIYELIQLKAIESILTNNLEYFERKVRRWYSKTFSTPLKETFKIPWAEVLLHYYESVLEEKDYNEVYELAASEYIPELAKEREIQDKEFEKYLIEEQKQNLEDKAKREGKDPQKSQSLKSEVSSEDEESKPEPITDLNMTFDDDI